MRTTLPKVASALAVCAHPDDESFGLGAVLSAFVDAGVLWKQAWMVELDGGSWAMRRTRTSDKVLRHVV